MQDDDALFTLALELWDYFYISQVPRPGDHKPWGMIERATSRIREAMNDFVGAVPVDVRASSARRIRAAARVALRHVEQLSARPEPWVVDALLGFEALADGVMRALAEPAKRLVLH